MARKGRMATYRSPSVTQVRVKGFWGERIAAVRERTAGILYDRAVEVGGLKQLDTDAQIPPYEPPFANDPESGRSVRRIFWDSDFGKIIETVGYLAANGRAPALEEKVDRLVDLYEKLQLPDGYLNSWYIRYAPNDRWTNLRDCHELYCLGHMLEGAIAYCQATGKEKLLNIVRRAIDHAMSVIGPEPGKKRGYPGHEELELALMKLYRLDGDRKYLEYAKYLIDERGTEPKFFEAEAAARGETENLRASRDPEYNQSHRPVREQEKIVGHAVRAMYLYCGMADVALDAGDDSLRAALDRIWDDLAARRLYVHGGMGPSALNEGFTKDYDLPNLTGYAETCAAVGLAFWAQRMLAFGPDSRYADCMELAMYNGALSGISLGGSLFFYENPLESDGTHHRWKWHLCPCCPPNIARMIASVGTYFYSFTDSALAVHLYGESGAVFPMAGGETRVEQKTDYPWSGAVELRVGRDRPGRFALQLRIPAWADGDVSLSVNGQAVSVPESLRKGYVWLDREWADGDAVRLNLPMRAKRVYARPVVRECAGRTAVKRGPLVYCLEQADNPGAPLNSLVLPESAAFVETFDPALLGGVVVLRAEGLAEEASADWKDALYRDRPPAALPVPLVFVPYSAWDNREPGEMLVWARRQ